jgi:hypothetical protein
MQQKKPLEAWWISLMLRVFVKLKGVFMLLKSLFLAAGIFVVSQTANAQFGMPSIPGVTSGSSSASAGNAADVIKNANQALTQYINSEQKIAKALGVYSLTQEQQDFLARRAKGDVAQTTKDDLNNTFTIGAELQASINKGIEEGKKLDASQKKLATEGTFEYLKALLSSKKLVDSVQGLAKNPTALGLDSIGPITALATNMPTMLSQSVSSTSTIIKYMAANGIDTSKMQKEADSLGK